MKKQSKLMTFLMSLLLAFMLAVPGNAVSTQAAGQGDMAVHFIDVGQGLAILVRSGGENLLYDGGNRAHADEVVQYLKNQQVETIDYMISSHYDEDHLGGLVKCLDNFEVEHVLGSDYVHTSDLFNTFMNTATAHAIIVEYPSVGDTISWNQEPCNDYTAGDAKQQSANSDTSQAAQYSSEDTASAPAVETETPDTSSDTQGRTVWISATGSKYHSRPDCGNMNPNKATQETEAQALSQGYEACKKCW